MCISLTLLLGGYMNATDIGISEIRISGNKTTKDFIILRELPFHAGDVFPEDKLIEQIQTATNHLNNTSIFNYVYVDYIPDTLDRDDCQLCIVTIEVEERWYFWPEVRLKFEDRNLSSWLQEKDISRITIGWGMRVDNVFGLRHTLSANHYFGYQKGFRMSYSNIALDKKRTRMLGISVVYLFNKTMNVISDDNKVVYFKDPENYLDKTFESVINYVYRPGIRNTHIITAGYRKSNIGDTVLHINKNYWGSERLSNGTFTATYSYNHEHRNFIAYPTKGYYAGTEVKGATADNLNFFYGSVNLKLQYYKELFPRWYWSSRLNAGSTFKNKKAYLYDQHVGYDEKNITGYDYYVIDGQHFSILNNDIRYCLMPQRVFQIGSSEKVSKFRKIHFTLYAKLSYDIGYVDNKYRRVTNTLANTFLWGSGVGLDLVTYYDIVLNCNYALNKMGQGAFYFGIKAPIF